jgi:hypothetical protein
MSRLGILFVLVLLVFGATITFAKSENSNSGNANPGMLQKEARKETTSEVNAKAAALRPSATCAPEGQWKNHGDYVKCVAQLHQGGQAVSEAARSDIGKKQATTSASFAPSPSASASASMSPSPVSTDSASPLPSFSPTPEATESGTVTAQVQKIFGGIRGFFKKLQSLLVF